MTYKEFEDYKNKIQSMTDSEKLEYIITILNKEVDMFTEGSDTYGVDFTREFEEKEEQIYNFLEALK